MNRNGILLIEPPPTSPAGNLRILGSTGALKTRMCWPPLDLMIIAGALKAKGIASQIFDCQALKANLSDLKSILSQTQPRAVAFSTSTDTLYRDMEVASVVKQALPGALTVAFGIHITSLPVETMQAYPDLDIAVYSEPESALPSFAQADFNPENSLGIYFRKNGEVLSRPPHPACADRDSLGFPAHDQIPLQLYHDPHMRCGPLSMTLAQQGCINECMYCVCPVFYGRLNQRSSPHVVEELAWAESLGVREIRFFDSGLTHSPEWFNGLLDGILKRNIRLGWACNSRADRLNQELLEKMKSAGCHTIWIGCESADEEILKAVGKNESPEEVENAVQSAKKAGLKTQVYFILGLPGETQQTMEKTIRFALKINPDIITLNIANPQPGTRLYEYLVKNNYLKTKDWSKYDPTLPPVFDYPQLKGEEIYAKMKQGYRRFYLRPGYIAKRMLGMRSAFELKNNVRIFLDFLRRY
jgi:radical SAM superfamily enzyme YgiQ (UPF0313 family)